MRMYVGDLKPDLVVTLLDGDTPVDLTAATSATVVGQIDGAFLFSRTGTMGGTAGTVTMAWQAADTDTAGLVTVEVVVTWTGSKPQTFRPADSITLAPRLPTS